VTAVDGFPAITLWQPRATLVAEGIKTWETRSWPTKYRGRLVIAAAARRPHARDAMGPWAINFTGAVLRRDAVAYAYNPGENRSLDLPLGVVVASANLVDCCPIGGPYSFRTGFVQGDEGDYPGQAVVVHRPSLGTYPDSLVVSEASTTTTDITDQLPFGIWEPGRWAWRLEDIAPTTDRCPTCWGVGEYRSAGRPGGITNIRISCLTCEGHGSCDPVPAKGGQRLWRWRP
jgi:hypothetical protein